MKSVINNEKKCFVCGSPFNIHVHHVYAGGRRKASEKYGAWVYLCAYHHNMSDEGVHFNRELDLKIKAIAQAELEKTMSRDEFRRHFGRSYL